MKELKLFLEEEVHDSLRTIVKNSKKRTSMHKVAEDIIIDVLGEVDKKPVLFKIPVGLLSDNKQGFADWLNNNVNGLIKHFYPGV